jgi:capsule biosynthesis phosphatase
MNNGLNVLIPIGGLGERFKEDGYSSPKPLINILGKLMIQYVIDCLDLKENDNVIIVYNKVLSNYSFKSRIESKKEITFIELPFQTKGASETVLYGLNNLSQTILNKPFVLLDCDNFYSVNLLELYRSKEIKNAVFSFEDSLSKPIYSYVKIENNTITDIKEKEKISNLANTGCYCFENGHKLKKYCTKVIENNITQNNEYYISCVIKEMLKDKESFECIVIPKQDFHCIGTPMHVKMFASNRKQIQSSKKLRICFDLDKCLVTLPKIKDDYSSVEPIQKNINILNYLKNIGHTIIIYTARRMRTHGGNIGKVTQEIGSVTLNQLEKFNIQYDEIYFGKPYAHFYIDDLAVNSYDNIEKELGFYNSNVEERDFNKLEFKSIDIIRKKSDDSIKIQAEINWYKNIPNEFQHLFPRMYDYGTNYYNIEFIQGLTFSYLYSHELLTPGIFNIFLNSLKLIHDQRVNNTDFNIYLNYCDKLSKRYFYYKDFYNNINKESEKVYFTIQKHLKNYEEQKSGKIAVIHGDPVFTNIMIDKDNNVKMFDMRGLLGDTITHYGDKYYDYAKIYQSLIGYDEIILNKSVSEEYRNLFIHEFKTFITETQFENIKKITNSLVFSLLPLHKNNTENCKKFYKLISFN